jgi:hypothetical protein
MCNQATDGSEQYDNYIPQLVFTLNRHFFFQTSQTGSTKMILFLGVRETHYQHPDYIALDGMMTDEQKVGKDLEGGSHGLIRVSIQYFPERNNNNHKRKQPQQDSQCINQNSN